MYVQNKRSLPLVAGGAHHNGTVWTVRLLHTCKWKSAPRDVMAWQSCQVMGKLIRQMREDIHTFKDEEMGDETSGEEQLLRFQDSRQMEAVYRNAKAVLDDDSVQWAAKEEAVRDLEWLWDRGLTVAAYQLGRCYRDGLGVFPDEEKAEEWFRRGADDDLDFSQYALGKLLQREGRIEEAVEWYGKAAAWDNQYANYRLGKLYLTGTEVPKDIDKAVGYLTDAAEAGNQYAQYTLGKLYLMGAEVTRDREEAFYWLTRSAEQGNQYAQFFLDRWDTMGKPSVMLSVTRLFHHMSRTFRNTPLPSPPRGLQIDRKWLQKLREKKIAMGHKPDGHEEHPTQGGMTMSGW